MTATTLAAHHEAELTATLAELDLTELNKKQLVVLSLHLTGRKGDAARTPKETYMAQAATAPRDAVQAALRKMVDEGDMVFQFADGAMSDGSDPDSDEDEAPAPAQAAQAPISAPTPATAQVQAPSSAVPPAPAPAASPAATPAPGAAVDGVAQALAALLQQSRGTVNPEQVADIVTDKLAEVIPALAARLEARLAEAVAGVEPQTRTVVVVGDSAPQPIGGLTHERFDKVVKLAGLRQNVLLVGPAGCGKTQLAAQVAEALGLPFAFLSCSAGMSESQLQGWLLPIAEAGRFAYVPSAFVSAYENGGVFLLDEIDAADENLLLVINSALANGVLALPQRTDNPVAKRHADFVCIAAANTYAHGADRVYAGRNQLDAATLDRFRNGIVAMDYSETLETALVNETVLGWGRTLRARINVNRLRRVLSTRVLIGYSQQLAAYGWGEEDWAESFFADWGRDELAKVGR